MGFAIGLLGGAVGLILGSLRLPALITILGIDPRVAAGSNLVIAAAVNSQASISRKVGGRVRIFGGALQGKNLAVVPKRMIVQTWRGSNWKKSEGDSILILTFTKTRGGGRINLVHVLPDRHYAGRNRGWKKYYWKPWRAYLRRLR